MRVGSQCFYISPTRLFGGGVQGSHFSWFHKLSTIPMRPFIFKTVTETTTKTKIGRFYFNEKLYETVSLPHLGPRE